MRVTNSMISNASALHIANAKDYVMTRQNQYSTGKKIMRPSEDPIVAIRSLQLRTTYSKLQQYTDKNIKDALSWMNSTETILNQIVGPTGITTSMKEKLNQGADDYLGQSQRHAVLEELQEYVKAIFQENANSDFAGRYLMTGYRTDTPLLFMEDTGVYTDSTDPDNPVQKGNLQYEIRQHLSAGDIRSISYVSSKLKYDATITDAEKYVEMGETLAQTPVYRMQLAYDNCYNGIIEKGATLTGPISIELMKDGKPLEDSANTDISAVTTEIMTSTALNESGEVNGTPLEDFMKDSDAKAVYLYDTGEIILNNAAYNRIQEYNAQIDVTYAKTEFEEGDIRPEMYFECKSYNAITNKTTEYRDPSNQNIQYEVNFTQTAVVNVQAKDALSTDIYRTIDYLAQTIYAMDDVERRLSEVDNLIENINEDDTDYEDKMEAYTQLKELLETEKKLRTKTMNEAFGMGLTMVDKAEDTLNTVMANLGTRYKRVELTRDKLEDDLLNTEEKLSDNEDVDIADAYVNLTQAETLYQAALSATAKILGNSLLNYI